MIVKENATRSLRVSPSVLKRLHLLRIKKGFNSLNGVINYLLIFRVKEIKKMKQKKENTIKSEGETLN